MIIRVEPVVRIQKESRQRKDPERKTTLEKRRQHFRDSLAKALKNEQEKYRNKTRN